MKKETKLILTIPPLANYGKIVEDPIVEAVRLNTTLSIDLPLEDILSRNKKEAGKKPVWIDLKCRQLRIIDYNVNFLRDKEIHYVTLSHKMKVDLPAEVFIDNGRFTAEISEIWGRNKLVIPGSVEKREGLPLPGQGEVGIRLGMSVNIPNPSLVIDGYFTDKDKMYIKAGKKLGMHKYLTSFTEQESDITDLLALDPDAEIKAKIESKKGLEFVKNIYPKYKKRVTLIAARGDGYTEVNRPDHIIDFCSQIIKADPNAIFASRMLESLSKVNETPKCQDLFDVYCGMLMGYKRFMLGDDVCTKEDSLKAAIGLFDVLSKKYRGGHNGKSIFLNWK